MVHYMEYKCGEHLPTLLLEFQGQLSSSFVCIEIRHDVTVTLTFDHKVNFFLSYIFYPGPNLSSDPVPSYLVCICIET